MGGVVAVLASEIGGTSSPLKKLNRLGACVQSVVKKAGRPVGSFKMTMERFAKNPPAKLPMTESQRVKELRDIMIRGGGKHVAEKVIEIALNDEHPSQMVALKMCLDRTLPVSMFEKDKSQRSAVTINITGIGEPPVHTTLIDSETHEVTDV
jgi:hypothetical protein